MPIIVYVCMYPENDVERRGVCLWRENCVDRLKDVCARELDVANSALSLPPGESSLPSGREFLMATIHLMLSSREIPSLILWSFQHKWKDDPPAPVVIERGGGTIC